VFVASDERSHFMKVESDCVTMNFTRNTMHHALVSRPQKEGPWINSLDISLR